MVKLPVLCHFVRCELAFARPKKDLRIYMEVKNPSSVAAAKSPWKRGLDGLIVKGTEALAIAAFPIAAFAQFTEDSRVAGLVRISLLVWGALLLFVAQTVSLSEKSDYKPRTGDVWIWIILFIVIIIITIYLLGPGVFSCSFS